MDKPPMKRGRPRKIILSESPNKTTDWEIHAKKRERGSPRKTESAGLKQPSHYFADQHSDQELPEYRSHRTRGSVI